MLCLTCAWMRARDDKGEAVHSGFLLSGGETPQHCRRKDRCWRLIIEKGKQRGYTFSHPDVLIAASAAHHGLTVVTRNVREFVEAGVAVINPWADPGTNP